MAAFGALERLQKLQIRLFATLPRLCLLQIMQHLRLLKDEEDGKEKFLEVLNPERLRTFYIT